MKRRFMSKNVMPRKVILAGLFAFCMSFFGFSTQAEAQSNRLHIPQDAAAMQTLVDHYNTKAATGASNPKMAEFTAINAFYVAVLADVQTGMSYKAAFKAHLTSHPNYDPAIHGGAVGSGGTGGGSTPVLLTDPSTPKQ